MPTFPAAHDAPLDGKWPASRLLAEARRRTRMLSLTTPAEVQGMLARLLAVAGWSGEEFVEALCHDVAARARAN